MDPSVTNAVDHATAECRGERRTAVMDAARERHDPALLLRRQTAGSKR